MTGSVSLTHGQYTTDNTFTLQSGQRLIKQQRNSFKKREDTSFKYSK